MTQEEVKQEKLDFSKGRHKRRRSYGIQASN